jgi:guanine nucleotide-binding protein G(I)/G(S)/G(T) subunit beta-1
LPPTGPPLSLLTMNSSSANDVSPEAMQARIQQARREAETLKDRIKRKKDELADTTRTFSLPLHPLI